MLIFDFTNGTVIDANADPDAAHSWAEAAAREALDVEVGVGGEPSPDA